MMFGKVIKSAAVGALGLVLAVPALAAGKPSSAVEMINALGCKGCHQIGGEGGTLGPPLDGLGKRLDGQKIRRQLLDPKAANPGSVMPSYAHLPEKDIDTLVDYLSSLK